LSSFIGTAISAWASETILSAKVFHPGLATEDEHHKRDKKRSAGDAMNDGPAAKKHSNSPPSDETQEQEGTKQIAKEDEDEEVEDEDEDEEDTGDEI
jgi:hypothetical protein